MQFQVRFGLTFALPKTPIDVVSEARWFGGYGQSRLWAREYKLAPDPGENLRGPYQPDNLSYILFYFFLT
jgi:hypothetical protein